MKTLKTAEKRRSRASQYSRIKQNLMIHSSVRTQATDRTTRARARAQTILYEQTQQHLSTNVYKHADIMMYGNKIICNSDNNHTRSQLTRSPFTADLSSADQTGAIELENPMPDFRGSHIILHPKRPLCSCPVNHLQTSSTILSYLIYYNIVDSSVC